MSSPRSSDAEYAQLSVPEGPGASTSAWAPEVSVVMPCLNEESTLETCVTTAQRVLWDNQLHGEVIVADNGSTDHSRAIAARLGARVVLVEARGYGNALMGGIAAARGKYIIMGDADDSYDFRDIPQFVNKLREGFDLVQGCRLPAGGGRILPGAMPFIHRWLGNPLLTALGRGLFQVPIHDVYCGLRGFTKEFYRHLDQRCTGMEFATEMIIKAELFGGKIAEIPITLRPDGRKTHPPHLKTWRDGWRTLRFFLMYSPRWLFLHPGIVLILVGLLGYGVALPGLTVGGVHFDAHTLLFASLAVLMGYQSILFAVFARTFAIGEGMLPPSRRMTRLYEIVNLERGLLTGALTLCVGGGLLLCSVNQWRLRDFGALDYGYTMRWVIPGVTLTALGFQTILSSFFISILGMRRR